MVFCNVICVTSSACSEGYVDRRKSKYAGGVYVCLRNERVLGVVNVSQMRWHNLLGPHPFSHPPLPELLSSVRYRQVYNVHNQSRNHKPEEGDMKLASHK